MQKVVSRTKQNLLRIPHYRCGSFATGVDVGADEDAPVGAGEVVGLAAVGLAAVGLTADEGDEVELAGDAETAAAGALCEAVGKDAAFGVSADEVIALSGFSR